ncbi:MAG TPA: HAD hydrolase-like protein [Bryobacteraceae bacterium]|nr:HAD hydrolase-like protein [Bryobacteraceae bacterium]
MQTIQAILLEPVGCLAEFPSAPFHEIAIRFFGRKEKAGKSGSQSYWHLLNLMETAREPLDDEKRGLVETLEAGAVDGASIYEDVAPALAELKAMGIQLFIASSLSAAATARFLDRGSLAEFFSGVWNRDNSGGIKAAPLARAIEGASLEAGRTIFLADTAEGLKAAESTGAAAILMMNDPDEALRLVAHNPAGGVVSLHELPDFIRLVLVNAGADAARS